MSLSVPTLRADCSVFIFDIQINLLIFFFTFKYMREEQKKKKKQSAFDRVCDGRIHTTSIHSAHARTRALSHTHDKDNTIDKSARVRL